MRRWAWLLLATTAWLAGCATAPPPNAWITGTAITRQRQYVPPGAQFDAFLLDVSDRAHPPRVLARQHIDDSGPPPYPLNLPYRQEQIQPHGRYEVRARVTLQGWLIMTTPGTHQVLLTPDFRHVDPILEPVAPLAASAQAAVPLPKTYWLLQDIVDGPVVGQPAEGAAPAHLRLDAADGHATGSGGCNRFVARYTQNGAQLRIQVLNTSLRLCLDVGASETAYLQRLQHVASFWQQGRHLELRDAQGEPLLRLVAPEDDTTPEPFTPQAPQ